MELLTTEIRARLIANGELRARAAKEGHHGRKCHLDFLPVVKLFTPDAGSTWLITEIDPSDHDKAFGLCDLGLGFPEIGYVSLTELALVRGRMGLRVERDLHFTPREPWPNTPHKPAPVATSRREANDDEYHRFDRS